MSFIRRSGSSSSAAVRGLAGACALSLGLAGAACGPKKGAENGKGTAADYNSGPDAKRETATEILVNTLATDEVNFDRGDMTDWKVVSVKNAQVMTVELHWDNAQADLTVDIFDAFGNEIAASPGASGEPMKKVVVPIEKDGQYYIRVTAPKPKEAAAYTLSARTEEPTPAPVAIAQPKAVEPKPVVHHDAKPPKEHKEKAKGEAVSGRVVSSYKEGGALVLHLDKGSNAGVKVGNSGEVLDGSSGNTPADGGSFTISEVIDGTKSIGKTSLKTLGKNTRVIIYVH